jgi:phosphohistidine phosphatase
MRHGKAEGSAPSGDDFDRALAPAGWDEARAIGKALARADVAPTFAIVSPALRTRQTWEGVSEAAPGAEVTFQKPLYNASASTLRSAFEAEEARAGTLILIGHNPGMHQLALELLVEGAADSHAREAVARGFPTATAVVFAVDVAGRPIYEALYLARDVAG